MTNKNNIVFSFAMKKSTLKECDCKDCRYINIIVPTLAEYSYIPLDKSEMKINHIYIQHKPQDEALAVPCLSFHVKLWMENVHTSTAHLSTFIIKVMSKKNSLEAERLFKNEVLFYKNIRPCMKYDLMPKCYFAYVTNTFYPSPIVLEDLMMNGYFKKADKLDNEMLHKYIRTLAQFHAETFRIQKEHPQDYKYFLENMKSDPNAEDRYEQAARAFMNSSVINNLRVNLRTKLLEKLAKVKQLQRCTILTIIHGCFTRDAVAQHCTDTEYRKIIDFQEVMIASPVIDFGRLALTNLPIIDNVTIINIQRFFNNTIKVYTKHLIKVYPEMEKNIMLLQQEIFDNLLFSYVNLRIDEREAIHNPAVILEVLNTFCTY